MKIKLSPSLPLFLLSLAASKNVAFVLIPISAALIHELGHLFAARALKIQIRSMRLGVFGAAIETNMLCCSYVKEAILALCGPLSNLITAGFVYLYFGVGHRHALLFIVSSLLLAILNLLPAGSFDGGRIFSSLLYAALPHRTAARISEGLSFLVFFTLWSASVYFIMKTGAYLSLFIFSWSLFTKLFISGGEYSSAL